MEIKKIKNIKNIGTYRKFQWPSTCDEFNQYNFFYGWNYSGKTTLSRIFRCLEMKVLHSDFKDVGFSLETDNGNITQRDIFEIAKDGTHEEMKAAIEAGVDIEVRDEYGMTPLHVAALFNTTPEVLLVLLKLGADPKARSKGGYTPWDYIQLNEAMKNTKAYWALNETRYE